MRVRRAVFVAVAAAALGPGGAAPLGASAGAQEPAASDARVVAATVRAHEGKQTRRRLPIVVLAGACTRAISVAELIEYADHVSVRVERQEPTGICQNVGITRCIEVKLRYALGARAVIDATDGRRVSPSPTPPPGEGRCTRVVAQRHEVRGRPRTRAEDLTRCKRRKRDGSRSAAACGARSN